MPIKRGYQKYTPRQRKRLVKRGVSKGFSNAQVNGIYLKGVEDLATSFNIEITKLKAKKYAKKMGNLLSFKPLRFPLNLNQYVASESRNYPLYMGCKRQIVREIKVSLPTGYKVNYLPKEIEFANAVGKLDVDYKQQKNKVTVDLNLILNQHQIEVADYQEGRKLFNKAGAVVQKQILIQKK